MSITVSALSNWLRSLGDDDSVHIDEGGLRLVSDDEPEAYTEIGGKPDTAQKDVVGYIAKVSRAIAANTFTLRDVLFLLTIKDSFDEVESDLPLPYTLFETVSRAAEWASVEICRLEGNYPALHEVYTGYFYEAIALRKEVKKLKQ